MSARGFTKALCLAALLFAGGAQAQDSQQVAAAPPGTMRIFLSNGLREPFNTVRAQAEKLIGKPFVVEYGATRDMLTKIENGQIFDAAILTSEAITDLTAKGKVVAGSKAVLAHAPVSIAVRGIVAINVSTPEAAKAALLGARKIGFYPVGAALPTVQKMFADLGVADTLKPKIMGLPDTNDKTPLPPAGQYDLVVNLVSEILPMTGGWHYAGNVPAPLQIPVTMAVGVGAKGDVQAGKKLVDFLKGPAMDAGLAANHMTR